MSLVKRVFWNLFSLWKPLTCVFSMHVFHHFAIWVSKYSFEETWGITKLIILDPWVQSYLPFNFTNLVENGWRYWITWFSWAGYRLRQEADLWTWVEDDDKLFMHQMALWKGITHSGESSKYRKWFTESLAATEVARSRYYRNEIFGIEILPTEEELDVGYDGPERHRFSSEVGPQRSQQPVERIRIHRPEADYRQGRANTYFVDPAEYKNQNTGSGTDGDDDSDDGEFEPPDFSLANLTDDEDTRPSFDPRRPKTQPQRDYEHAQRKRRQLEREAERKRHQEAMRNKLRREFDSDIFTHQDLPDRSVMMDKFDNDPQPFSFSDSEEEKDYRDSYLFDR